MNLALSDPEQEADNFSIGQGLRECAVCCT